MHARARTHTHINFTILLKVALNMLKSHIIFSFLFTTKKNGGRKIFTAAYIMWLQNTATHNIIITFMKWRKLRKLLHIQNQGIAHPPPSHIIGSILDNFRLSRLFNPDVHSLWVIVPYRSHVYCWHFHKYYLSAFSRWNHYPCGTFNTYSTYPLYRHQVMANRRGHLKFPQPTCSASALETSASWHQIWSGPLIFLIPHWPTPSLCISQRFHSFITYERLTLFRFILLSHFPQLSLIGRKVDMYCKHWEGQWGRCFGPRCRQ